MTYPTKPIQGGSDDASDLKERLKTRMAEGRLPSTAPTMIFARKGSQGHRWTACDNNFRRGEAEYEVKGPDWPAIYLHQHCLELWLQRRAPLPAHSHRHLGAHH